MGEEGIPRGWGYGGAPSTSLFIRRYLLERGEGYAMEIWRALKREREKLGLKCGSYQSFRSNFWSVLIKLGLIEFTGREEPASRPGLKARRYYRITPGREDDPRWRNPQGYLDPRRRLGGRRYKKLKSRE